MKNNTIFRTLLISGLLILCVFSFKVLAQDTNQFNDFANPMSIKGLTVDPNNPFNLDFVIDVGNSPISLNSKIFKKESLKLIKYFLSALTIPDSDLWVNLSPYEEDRIISDALAQTTMGIDLLEQDYQLKKYTAFLMDPNHKLGEKFWKIYHEEFSKYCKIHKVEICDSNSASLEMFNKVWIVPEKAIVYEKWPEAFIVESQLKVHSEQDYLAAKKGRFSPEDFSPQLDIKQEIAFKVFKDLILPKIEKEINNGSKFSNLRQIYHSMVLATWYKKTLQQALLGNIYTDQNRMKGIDDKDTNDKEKIFNNYVSLFREGVLNFVREEYHPTTKQIISNKYISGGFHQVADVLEVVTDRGQLTDSIKRYLFFRDTNEYQEHEELFKVSAKLLTISATEAYSKQHFINNPQSTDENYELTLTSSGKSVEERLKEDPLFERLVKVVTAEKLSEESQKRVLAIINKYTHMSAEELRKQTSFVKQAEIELGQYLQLKNKKLFLTSSGREAMGLLLDLWDIGKGLEKDNEIIVPGLGYQAVYDELKIRRLKPVFVDIDPKTLNIDLDDLEKSITNKTKAIILVDNYGLPNDYDAVQAIVEKQKREFGRDIKIFIDSAESFGATYRNKPLGNQGDGVMFSFSFSKPIHASGKGGALIVPDYLAKKIVDDVLWNRHGLFQWKKMQEFRALVLLELLKDIDRRIKNRQEVARFYEQRLKQIPGLRFQAGPLDRENVYTHFPIIINKKEFGIPSFLLQIMLANQNVETKKYFPNVHFAGYSEQISDDVLSLPIGGDMSLENVAKITDHIQWIYENRIEIVDYYRRKVHLQALFSTMPIEQYRVLMRFYKELVEIDPERYNYASHLSNMIDRLVQSNAYMKTYNKGSLKDKKGNQDSREFNLESPIFIVGIDTYIGQHLAKYLVSKGYSNIVGLGEKKMLRVLDDVYYSLRNKNLRFEPHKIVDDVRLKIKYQYMTEYPSIKNPEGIVRQIKKMFNEYEFQKVINLYGTDDYYGQQVSDALDQCFSCQVLGDVLHTTLTQSFQHNADYIQIDSGLVYHSKDEPSKEEDPIGPLRNYYTEMLTMSRLLAQQVYENGNPALTILRLGDVYGPGHQREGVFPYLIHNIQNNEPISIKQEERDFIYIDDVLSAIELTMQKNIKPGIYNVGTSMGTSVPSLLVALSEQLGREALETEVILDKEGVNQSILDNAKFQAATGWQPKVSLKEGITQVLSEIDKDFGQLADLQSRVQSVSKWEMFIRNYLYQLNSDKEVEKFISSLKENKPMDGILKHSLFASTDALKPQSTLNEVYFKRIEEMLQDMNENGNYVQGIYINQAEQKVADLLGIDKDQVFLLSNAKDAVSLLFYYHHIGNRFAAPRLMDFSRNDEVIVPLIGSEDLLDVLRIHRLKPVFADMDIGDPDLAVEGFVTNKTGAVIYVDKLQKTISGDSLNRYQGGNLVIINYLSANSSVFINKDRIFDNKNPTVVNITVPGIMNDEENVGILIVPKSYVQKIHQVKKEEENVLFKGKQAEGHKAISLLEQFNYIATDQEKIQSLVNVYRDGLNNMPGVFIPEISQDEDYLSPQLRVRIDAKKYGIPWMILKMIFNDHNIDLKVDVPQVYYEGFSFHVTDYYLTFGVQSGVEHSEIKKLMSFMRKLHDSKDEVIQFYLERIKAKNLYYLEKNNMAIALEGFSFLSHLYSHLVALDAKYLNEYYFQSAIDKTLSKSNRISKGYDDKYQIDKSLFDKNSPILVLGTGYIGTRLIKDLLDKGYTRIVVIGKPEITHIWKNRMSFLKDQRAPFFTKMRNIGKFFKNLKYYSLNFNDRGAEKRITELFKKYKFKKVINVSGFSDAKYANHNIGSYVDSIIGPVFHRLVLESKRFGAQYMQMDTGLVYQGAEEINSELSKIDPFKNFYVEVKNLMRMLPDVYDYPAVTFRLSNVYGPELAKDKVISIFINKIRAGASLTISSDIKDFIYIDDVINAIVLSMEKNLEPGVYNLASQEATSINSLATELMKQMNTFVKISLSQIPPRNMLLSNEKLVNALNNKWIPTVSLEEGLRHVLELTDGAQLNASNVGGIDLHPQQMKLIIDQKSPGFNTNILPVPSINFGGLYPIILNIKPISSSLILSSDYIQLPEYL